MFEIIAESMPEQSSYLIGAGALLFASFTSLFSVVNPLAAMPLFLSLTDRFDERERIQTAKRASVYMFGVLIVFLLLGTYILSFFGISLAGIRIAGGLIIMRAAYSMLNPEKGGKKLTDEDEAAALEKEDISFSPLALPLLSGPGSIAVVIGFATQAEGISHFVVNGISIFLVVVSTYILLRLAPISAKYIGPTGLNVMTRLMGFIALAISVQFILSGISRYFGI
ncbi:MAG: MarC family NAAT transporter [Balneolaceae bacterium]|nr:MarC family NAAT transporter [Balneolaceae bacterium]MCH8549659.1 MarC family NAAT transporter [Balneolaceae bacterium]